MRLAVIADVHGNLPALEAVLEHAAARGVDTIVNLGDCCTAPLWPAETLALLRASDIPTVRGNHDRWLSDDEKLRASPLVAHTRARLDDDAVMWLAALPPSLRLDDVLAVHGTPTSDVAYLLETTVDHRLSLTSRATLDERLGDTDASLVLCGHSHLQHVAAASGNRVVLNPGSVGCPRAAGNADAPLNEASSPHARYAIATRRGARWSIELFALAYDWDAVAQRAISQGCATWAESFLGGGGQ